MIEVQSGQCGLCAHFGAGQPEHKLKLAEIRADHKAPEDLVLPCGLEAHAQYNLWVTPRSSCDGFAPSVTEQFEANEPY
jgi:hypothetical protein